MIKAKWLSNQFIIELPNSLNSSFVLKGSCSFRKQFLVVVTSWLIVIFAHFNTYATCDIGIIPADPIRKHKNPSHMKARKIIMRVGNPRI